MSSNMQRRTPHPYPKICKYIRFMVSQNNTPNQMPLPNER